MRFSPRLRRHDAVRACVGLASLAAIACSTEQLSSPRPGDAPSLAAGGKKTVKPTITDASGPSLAIGGSAGTFTVLIANQTNAKLSQVSLQASIQQGSGSRSAGDALVACSGGASGVLDVGGCTTPFSVTADNAASGSGTLVPGTAKLVINLVQAGTVLDTKTFKISLTAGPTTPYIKNIVQSFTTFVAGVPQNYTVTLSNPTGTNQSIVIVQAYFVQNGSTYAGSGTNVLCTVPEASGNLPPGDCTFTSESSLASIRPSAGAATWRLELTQFVNGATTLLDYKEIPVTIQ